MKNNKGITLIALIITILVMLILAAVSINMVIGEDGVISRAEEAKKVQEEAKTEENIDISILAAVADGKGKIETVEQLKKQFKDGYKITEVTGENAIKKEYIIEDLNNEKSYYVYENGKKQKIEILNSTENGKNFSWISDSTNKKVKDLKFSDKEYEGIVKFPDYIKYGDELYGVHNIQSHREYKFVEVIMPIKIISAINGLQDGYQGLPGMFRKCENLNKITINNIEDTKITGSMFMECSKLKEVVFNGKNIMMILANVFRDCNSLESIKLPKELNSLDAYAFKDCTKLKYVYFGENISSINDTAFYNCTSLERIQINKTNEEIKEKFPSLNESEYTKGKVYDKNGNLVTF